MKNVEFEVKNVEFVVKYNFELEVVNVCYDSFFVEIKVKYVVDFEV